MTRSFFMMAASLLGAVAANGNVHRGAAAVSQVVHAALIHADEHEGRLPTSIDQLETILAHANWRGLSAKAVVWVAPEGVTKDWPPSTIVAVMLYEYEVVVGTLDGKIQILEGGDAVRAERLSLRDRYWSRVVAVLCVSIGLNVVLIWITWRKKRGQSGSGGD